jgi:hypothetical protein
MQQRSNGTQVCKCISIRFFDSIPSLGLQLSKEEGEWSFLDMHIHPSLLAESPHLKLEPFHTLMTAKEHHDA